MRESKTPAITDFREGPDVSSHAIQRPGQQGEFERREHPFYVCWDTFNGRTARSLE
jgi:hypothetical protein